MTTTVQSTEVSSMGAPPTDVLIVGAGPTGLVLALSLVKFGISVRIIDKTHEPGTTSRATVVHARTLELYQQMGIADAAINAGIKFAGINLWIRNHHVARIPLGDLGTNISPYPFILIFTQDMHERMLVNKLEELGVHVERDTSLVSFTESVNGISAQLATPNGDVACTARYIAGCDGARSTVREQLHVEFSGSTYDDLFYVADIEAAGPATNGEMHGALDEADFLVVFPMKGRGRVRLVGQVKTPPANGAALRWEDVRDRVVGRLDLAVNAVHWFSSYHVHHRIASTFRRSRAFLLGDAAHIHSPVGGQGMNTGIGDAYNLAWKIAGVLSGRAGASILESYESERMTFAKQLVATTDRAFQLVTSNGFIARHIRTNAVPTIMPRLFQFQAVRRLMFRTVSQTALHYPDSILSVGKAGHVSGGDRLPYVPSSVLHSTQDNFAVLQSRGWQVHVYGAATDSLRTLCSNCALPLHEFIWNEAMRPTGLAENAVYLVRPDGYVAVAETTDDVATLEQFLDAHGIQPAH